MHETGFPCPEIALKVPDRRCMQNMFDAMGIRDN